MSEQLIKTVKERINSGYTDEVIRTELSTAGYTDEVIENLLIQAKAEITPDNNSIPTATAIPIPKATGLIIDSLKFLFVKRPELFFVLLIPVFLINYISEKFVGESSGIFGLAFLGALVLNYFLGLAVLYVISHHKTEAVTLGAGIDWVLKHFLSLLWISILSFLIVLGGFLLFLIPGVIVSVLIAFSVWVFMHEDKRGMEAVLRSRQLILGRAMSVFGELAILMIILILLMITGVFLSSFLFSDLFTVAGQDWSWILSSMFDIVSSIIVWYAMTEIYHWLVATYVPTVDNIKNVKWKYLTLAWLGIVAPIIMITLSTIFLTALFNSF